MAAKMRISQTSQKNSEFQPKRPFLALAQKIYFLQKCVLGRNNMSLLKRNIDRTNGSPQTKSFGGVFRQKVRFWALSGARTKNLFYSLFLDQTKISEKKCQFWKSLGRGYLSEQSHQKKVEKLSILEKFRKRLFVGTVQQKKGRKSVNS